MSTSPREHDRIELTDDDWGGPYVSIVAIATEIASDEDDRGIRYNLNGIASSAVIERLGNTISGRLQIVLYPGRRTGPATLMVDSVDPLDRVISGAATTVRFSNDPSNPVHSVFPFVLETPVTGTYWLRLWADGSLLTQVPLTVEVASPIPDAFYS